MLTALFMPIAKRQHKIKPLHKGAAVFLLSYPESCS